jgi:glycosyltransferase involved in cell wall biosynthesis
MTVYNAATFVEESVGSVLAQGYSNWEFVIVDDSSTDGTYEILQKFSSADARIRLFRMAKNLGKPLAANFGFSQCNGKYIALLDADDVLMPQRLDRQVEFMESNPEIGMCGSNVDLMDQTGEPVCTFIVPSSHDSIMKTMVRHDPFFYPSVMLRKSLLQLCGGFNIHLRFVQDYDLWIRVASVSAVANMQEVFAKVRLSEGSTTRRNIKGFYYSILKVKLTAVMSGFLPKRAMIYCWKEIVYLLSPIPLIDRWYAHRIKRDRRKKVYVLK